MINSKLIAFVGPPSSGKSTLASSVHSKLKMLGENSIFIGEVATDYIAEYGIPSEPEDQMTIFYKQLNKEKMFIGIKDYVICDSSSLLNYFYFRNLFPNKLSQKDIGNINNIQKEILKSINNWDYIFFLPANNFSNKVDDGVRFHNSKEIEILERRIKSYLEIENINHTDLSTIEIDKRIDYIISLIKE